MAVGRFLGGVAAVIWSPQLRRYLLLRRASDKDFAPGVWEPVTGRLEQGEGFQQALQREVLEEVGATVQVDMILGTTHFYRGECSPQTELIGVVFLCSLDDPDSVRLSAEHSEHRWADLVEAKRLLTASDPSTQWFRRVLMRAAELQDMLSMPMRDWFRQAGTDLDRPP